MGRVRLIWNRLFFWDVGTAGRRTGLYKKDKYRLVFYRAADEGLFLGKIEKIRVIGKQQ